jgi:hypothetical protein
VASRINEPKSDATRKYQEYIMKTEFKSIAKDNIATAAVLAATFITIVGAIVESSDALADHRAAPPPVQRMETITVTAHRTDVAMLETILATASRDARTLVALK